MECVLCHRLVEGFVIARNELAAAFPDAFPVSPGHVLIVPHRHEADFFALTLPEQQAMVQLIPVARAWVEAERSPGGYNLGVNIGSVGGQTIPHVHLHLIPRYSGDVPDPRGGVRWVLPERAPYWKL
jgi:diadenosine tetraphosphate (Ap4A) HIT family hydrolase